MEMKKDNGCKNKKLYSKACCCFMMDGDGRWAKKRMMPRKMGHVEDGKVLKKQRRIL
jgi:Undecaprenyl pyrophosphate synthase